MNFEDQNFRNLVYFFSDRLLQVAAGRHASDLFTENERKRLKKWGVLHIVWIRYWPPLKLTLPTPEAQRILEELC